MDRDRHPFRELVIEKSVTREKQPYLALENNTQIVRCNEDSKVCQIGNNNTSIQTGARSAQIQLGEALRQQQAGDWSRQVLANEALQSGAEQHQTGDHSSQVLLNGWNAIQTQQGEKCVQFSTDETTQEQEGAYNTQFSVSREHSWQTQIGGKAIQVAKGLMSYQRQLGNNNIQVSLAEMHTEMFQKGDNCDLLSAGGALQTLGKQEGNFGVLFGIGECSFEVVGEGAVLFGLGPHSQLKAGLGSWLIFGDWESSAESWEYERSSLIGIKVFRVDGKKVKADTWYKLENGKLKEQATKEVKK